MPIQLEKTNWEMVQVLTQLHISLFWVEWKTRVKLTILLNNLIH